MQVYILSMMASMNVWFDNVILYEQRVGLDFKFKSATYHRKRKSRIFISVGYYYPYYHILCR